MTDVAIDGHMTPIPDTAPIPIQVLGEPQHIQPDTIIPVSQDTTVVVQTNTSTVRDYALMFRMHLSNGTKKVTGFISFVKGRLGEKTTYVFLGAGIAAASALPAPWSYASMGVSFIAAMVPDHVITDPQTGDHT